MNLNVSETPAKMTTRRRIIEFTGHDLITVLVDYCRTQGIEISVGSKLNIWGIEHNHGADAVTLCIDGD